MSDSHPRVGFGAPEHAYSPPEGSQASVPPPPPPPIAGPPVYAAPPSYQPAPYYAYPAQPVAPYDPNEGKTVQIVGYVMAGASFVIPLLGLPGLILGIITATKRGRGGHGAAIICLSIVLALVGFALWTSLALHSAANSTTTNGT